MGHPKRLQEVRRALEHLCSLSSDLYISVCVCVCARSLISKPYRKIVDVGQRYEKKVKEKRCG